MYIHDQIGLQGTLTSNKNYKGTKRANPNTSGSGPGGSGPSCLISSETQIKFNRIINNSRCIKEKLNTLKNVGISNESNSLF